MQIEYKLPGTVFLLTFNLLATVQIKSGRSMLPALPW
jgi:hypothetical protein